MHMHKYEKIWLYFGGGALLIFLIVIGVSAFYMGSQPPSCLVTVDPENVEATEPFDEPGVKQIGENEYQVTMVAQAFSFTPNKIEIPKGATVHYTVTTKDVVHGFEIAGTNVNMMLTPGYISTYTETYDEAGEYLILCNEYCGTGHQLMSATVEVVEQ